MALSKPYKTSVGFGTTGRQSPYGVNFGSRAKLVLTPDSFVPGAGWEDLSGNGNHYTGSGPTISTVGGIPCVTFNGSSHYLSGPALSNFSSSGLHYSVAVCYATGDATTPMAAGVWASAGGADVPSQGIGYVKVGAENRFNSLYHRASGGGNWQGVDVEADADGKWVLVEAGYDGTTHRVRGTDASAVIDTTSSTPGGAPWNMDQLTAIGRGVENSTNLYYTGHIAMIVNFRGTPTAADMALVRSFCNSRFGIADPGSNLF